MSKAKRHDGRRYDQLRPVKITPGFISSATGSCLIEVGRTRVVCTASFSSGVPKWREGSLLGWVTAEYGMLPASTSSRKGRPILKPDGRSMEIQRIIGRCCRNVVDFARLGPNTVYLDCDVLEADGGTRTASITGAYVALALAAENAAKAGLCGKGAIKSAVAAVSVGIVDGRVLLDLDYSEDSTADVDANIAMTGSGEFVEVQSSGEGAGFSASELDEMLGMARKGIRKLLKLQRQAIRTN